jgi:hypothetical protein
MKPQKSHFKLKNKNMENTKKLKIGILMILVISILIIILSSITYADLYLNSRTGNINLNTTGQTRLQITPGGNLNLIGLVNVSIPGNLSVGGNVSVDGSTLFADSENNRVGIGTTSPDTLLEINGGASSDLLKLESSDGTRLIFNDTGEGKGFNIRVAGIGPYLGFNSDDAGNILVLKQTGDVGIGTDSPNARLEVNTTTGTIGILTNGTISLDNYKQIGFSNSSGAQNYWQIFSDDSAGAWAGDSGLSIFGNGASRVSITASGNVGIGTISPDYTLHVAGDDLIINGSTVARLRLGTTTREWAINNNNAVSDALQFYDSTASETRMVIDTSGNVGIGTTSPAALLNIHGGNQNQLKLSNAVGNWTIGPNGIGALAISFANITTGTDVINIATNSNVGIGTTSPASTLDLTKTSDAGERAIKVQNSNEALFLGVEGSSGNRFLGSAVDNAFIGTTTADGLELATNNNVRMIIESGGNVGIGTTGPGPSAIDTTANKVLQIGGASLPVIVLNSSNSAQEAEIIHDGAGLGIKVGGHATASNNIIAFWTDNSANSYTGAERMRIDSAGNVGIGTTTPGAKLHTDVSTGGVIALFNSSSSGDAYISLQAGVTDTIIGSNRNTNGFVGTLTSENFSIRTGNTDQIWIDTSGNVGIGTTNPPPGVKLTVSNSGAGAIDLHPIGGINNQPYIQSYNRNSISYEDLSFYAEDYHFWSESANSETVTITTDGNVGIGTTSPVSPLHIFSSASSDILILNNTASGYGPIITMDASGNGGRNYRIMSGATSNGAVGAGRFGIWDETANEGRLIIDTNGNVGIGTTSPSETLSVNGNVSIEGANCRDSGGAATCNNFVDIAELFPSSEKVESGDVVTIDIENEGKLKRSSIAYETSVAGIVSTQPAIVIEGNRLVAMGGIFDNQDTFNPAIALAGRVPVKVTNENGIIKSGDLLTTSSKKGHAMKFSLLDLKDAENFHELKSTLTENERRRNSILGKALESFNGESGKVTALITLQ